ncbi:ferrochelatase [uncultured Pseudokineococcus sp.]|uniref:ferrochelatase n=1 Tax=uncultured Pseudokineococcus sp. TaxID=1642928 RepID=UPI00261CC26E|nr:ferrochelatase [uncultured Pseudokineococcus sp.]
MPSPETPAAPGAPAPGSSSPLAPYDALLLLSFGGPEGHEDVMPFLRTVTAGRGIPDERLEAVAEHYHHFGGKSPINDQNRALLAALRADLAARGLDVPVAWGNRNWAPFVTDALRELHEDGARRVLVVATSAYASYSGCRQYREDVAGALVQLAEEGRDLQVDKIRHYFDAPGFVAANVDAVAAAWERLPEAARPGAELVFVTHSIPTAMADSAGPEGGAYVRQHEDVAQVVADAVRRRAGGAALPSALVYCSRSGPPSQPWTEPDVNDHLEELAARGVPGVVVAPIGFVSDHMEVVYDLDTEARETAERLGLPMERAGTAGTDPAFVAALVDLVVERAAVERAAAGGQEAPPRPSAGSVGPSHDVCPVGCCPNLRREKPAACGRDWPGARALVESGAATPGSGA